MGIYRESRNIEASFIDLITEALEDDGWTGIRVEKAFSSVYNGELPCILVQEVNSSAETLEIGNYYHILNHLVNINIFAKNDGQRLDLKDWLFRLLEKGIVYYEYTIANGEVDDKNENGRITITRFIDNRKVYENSETVEEQDRYRHLLSFECRVNKII